MKIISREEKIRTLLSRAVTEIIVKDHLENELKSGRRLRVKFGIDPTSPDIHLGHSVPLLKLKQFQDLGHQAVLIIGDFTAQIGDPAGRLEARKPLAASNVRKNMKNYLKQAGRIIDIKKTEIHYNGKWFSKMKLADFYKLAGKVTVQQVLKRGDFKKRLENDQDIAATEMMYPLLQGYDSVMVKADVEIGGEDQLVNLLMGRKIQRAYGLKEQDILTTWLIEGTDGSRKMSKSFNNYIGIAEAPGAMFGKLMSIPDSLVIKYFEALTTLSQPEGETNPRDAKSRLAFEIVGFYHGAKKAGEAAREFERVFRKHELPENIEEVPVAIKPRNIVELLIQVHLAPSRGEAQRKILENAVKVDGKVINDPKAIINVCGGMVVQLGKRNFRKIKKSR